MRRRIEKSAGFIVMTLKIQAPLDGPLFAALLREHLISGEVTLGLWMAWPERRLTRVFDARYYVGLCGPQMKCDPAISLVALKPRTAAEKHPDMRTTAAMLHVCGLEADGALWTILRNKQL